MRALRFGLCLSLAALLGGCLDQGGGPEDQWMNTDAYVGPEVSVRTDGGVSCGDATVFADPVRLSDDREPDGGPIHAQYGVTMAPGASGKRYAAWIDRNLAANGTADLRAASVTAAGQSPALIDVERPVGCDLLVDPALATTAAGTAVLVATCITGPEGAPTQTEIVTLRSTDGLKTFEAPGSAAICLADTQECGTPAVAAAPGGSVYVAWSEWDIAGGTLNGGRVRVWRSDDDGETLAEEVMLTDSFAVSEEPRLAADAGDALHLVYTGAFTVTGSGYAVYAAQASATAFDAPEVLGPGYSPRVAVTGDGVYAVWVAGAGSLYEAHDLGGGFSPPLPVLGISGITDLLPPALAGDAKGWVHVVWQARDDAGWNAYYGVTKDQGDTWYAPLAISEPFDGDPTGQATPAHWIGAADLVADDAGVMLGWGDSAEFDQYLGASNVYLAVRVCQ